MTPSELPTPDTLGESTRRTVSAFVRQVRAQTSTMRDARLETLEVLESCGASTIAALARARGVKHQSMRLVVAELENEGLLTRTDNPDDARAQLIGLSETATQRLAEARAQRAGWITERIESRLSVEQRVALAHGLDMLRLLAESDVVDH